MRILKMRGDLEKILKMRNGPSRKGPPAGPLPLPSQNEKKILKMILKMRILEKQEKGRPAKPRQLSLSKIMPK